MHQSAMYYGQRFFETYCNYRNSGELTVVEIGSQDVNGSLREACSSGFHYIGLDFVEGKGVDIVIDDPYRLPLEDASADIVVSSSCFEHSEFFWLVFLEVMRILKDDGIFYLNVPSNGFFHRWPVDCWRFYPDSGHALVNWARRNGYKPTLLESFIGQRSAGQVSEGGMWNDFVAIFVKNETHAVKYPERIIHLLQGYCNGYTNKQANILNFNERGPDFSLIEEQAEKITSLSQVLIKRDSQITSLNEAMSERDTQFSQLERQLTEAKTRIQGMEQSRSWRITAPYRVLGSLLRASIHFVR